MSETLEQIKKRISNAYVDDLGDYEIVHIEKIDLDWLIEQVDKVEKFRHDLQYEKENRMFDKAEIERLKKENRQCRVAITNAMDKCKWNNMETYEILEKVLEI